MDRRDFLHSASWLTLALAAGKAAADAPIALAARTDAYLSDDQMRLVTAVADIMIPATDTPGALAADVPQFIGLLYREWFSAQDQAQFREGLGALDAESRRLHGRALADCSADQRFALLDRWDEAAFVAPPTHAPPPFFARFKELILVGYYTSRIGQEQELHTVLDAGENEAAGPVMMAPPFSL